MIFLRSRYLQFLFLSIQLFWLTNWKTDKNKKKIIWEAIIELLVHSIFFKHKLVVDFSAFISSVTKTLLLPEYKTLSFTRHETCLMSTPKQNLQSKLFSQKNQRRFSIYSVAFLRLFFMIFCFALSFFCGQFLFILCRKIFHHLLYRTLLDGGFSGFYVLQ